MTTQTIVTMFIAFGGLRLLEEGAKYLIKQANQVVKTKLGEKKYNKLMKIVREEVVNVIGTLNKSKATVTALENIKSAVIGNVAQRTGLPSDEIEKFVDTAIDDVKKDIEINIQEDKTVTVTDETLNNVNNTAPIQQPVAQ